MTSYIYAMPKFSLNVYLLLKNGFGFLTDMVMEGYKE